MSVMVIDQVFPVMTNPAAQNYTIYANSRWNSSLPPRTASIGNGKVEKIRGTPALGPAAVLSRSTPPAKKVDAVPMVVEGSRASDAAPEVAAKKQDPTKDSASWGPIFQNREHFVEMHIG
jgi:hypothetical protein